MPLAGLSPLSRGEGGSALLEIRYGEGGSLVTNSLVETRSSA